MCSLRSALCVVLVVWGLGLRAEDRRPDKSQLVVMTLNAEFLWDGVLPEEGVPQVSFPWKGDPAAAADHMEEIADMILSANPDIVNLCEVESLATLRKFNSEYLVGQGYAAYLQKGRDTYTGQDVALLTRIDPEGGRVVRDDRKGKSHPAEKSMSKNYVAKFQVDGEKFAMLGVHLLSRPTDVGRVLQRQAQADAVRSICEDLSAEGYELIVLGDFNDYDGNEDSLDHAGNEPVTDVLSRIREANPAKSDDNLMNVASFIPRAERYTAFWDANGNGEINSAKELTSIDHILLSPSLAARVDSAEIPHATDPRTTTDHFPVVVRIDLDGAGLGGVRILSLLPNPTGEDSVNEFVTVKNTGTESVSLQGWKLRDTSGKTWSLSALGDLAAGATAEAKRGGQEMSLNNGGDTIELIDRTQRVVDTVSYTEVEEEELVTFRIPELVPKPDRRILVAQIRTKLANLEAELASLKELLAALEGVQ